MTYQNSSALWRSPRNRTEPGRSLWLCGISTWPAGLYFAVLLGGAIPLLAHAAGMSDRQLGLLTALPFATSLIQIFTARLTEGAGRRKAIFVLIGTLTRILWIPMALAPFLLGPGQRAAQVILWIAAGLHLGNNLIAPAWQSWLADLVPSPVRGRFFAWRGSNLSLSMLGFSILAGWVLPRTPDAPHLRWILLVLLTVASVAGALEIRFYKAMADPGPVARGTDWRSFVIPLRNREFRVFLGFNFFSTAGAALLGPFLWKHFLVELQMDGLRATLMLQSAPMLAVVLISPIWGRALDRWGARPLWKAGILGGTALSFGWFFIHPSGWIAGLVLAGAIQIFWTAVDQANFVLLMRFSSIRDRAQPVVYATLFNLSVALAGALAGILGGDLVQRLGAAAWVSGLGRQLSALPFSPYLILLFLSCIPRGAAWFLFGRRLAEPGAADSGEFMKSMSRGFFAGMQNALFFPLRSLAPFLPGRIRPSWIRVRPVRPDSDEES